MGLFSNPLNWKITDTLQGQEGGFALKPNSFLNAANSFTGSSGGQANFSNPTGYTGVLGASTSNQQTGGNYDPAPAPAPQDNWAAEQNAAAARQAAATAAKRSQDLAYLDSQQSIYERMMQSLGSTLNSGISNLDNSKTQAENSARDQQGRALRDFEVKRGDSANAKQDAIGKVDTNARTLSDSLRRVLGMASGSGSSAYQFAAPQAVARQASQQRGNVLSNFGKNERDLDTAVNDTNVDFQSVLENIAQQRREKEESLRAGILQQEQGLQGSLSDIASERAGLLGGNALSATAPYRDRYMGIQNELDALPSRFANAITPRELKVSTPKLSDYLVDRQALNASNQTGEKQYSPYKAFIQKDEEEQNLGY